MKAAVLAIVPAVELEEAIVLAREAETASETGRPRVAAAGAGAPSEEVRRDTTEQARVRAAAAAARAWDRLAVEAVAVGAEAVVAGGADEQTRMRKGNHR